MRFGPTLARNRERVREGDLPEAGDQWVFVAIDPESKLVPVHTVGKRTEETTWYFMQELAGRLATRVQLTTDGFHFYRRQVEDAFGEDVDFAQLIKLYGRLRAARLREQVFPKSNRGGHIQGAAGRPGPGAHLHVTCGTAEPHHADADAPVHPADERFLEEADEPESGLRFALLLLQFCAGTLIIARNARNGRWHRHRNVAARSVASCTPIRKAKCMNEISSGVAFWILDAWRKMNAQLQVAVFPGESLMRGSAAVVSKIVSSEVVSIRRVDARGQNTVWTPSFAGCRFSFAVPSEASSLAELAGGKWVSYLVVVCPDGKRVVFGENTQMSLNY